MCRFEKNEEGESLPYQRRGYIPPWHHRNRIEEDWLNYSLNTKTRFRLLFRLPWITLQSINFLNYSKRKNWINETDKPNYLFHPSASQPRIATIVTRLSDGEVLMYTYPCNQSALFWTGKLLSNAVNTQCSEAETAEHHFYLPIYRVIIKLAPLNVCIMICCAYSCCTAAVF